MKRPFILYVVPYLALLLTAGPGRAAGEPMAPPQDSMSDRSTAVGRAPDVARAVDGARLVKARSEPQNWMTYYGAYDGQRYSTLDQISTANVKGLRPAWTFQFGNIGLVASPATYSFEAAPIIVDGVMYVSGWEGHVWAMDAVTGQLLWHYQHAIPLDTPLCCGNVNRGVAVAKGKVIFATANAYLVALDAVTGKPVWKKPFADVRAGETATAAPLIVKDLVIAGSSGAEYGIRGHLDAFDIETGKRAWRTYTIPKPGEPGSETWGGKETWARGGGSTWITGSYDPDLNLVYWGTSNPGPDFDGSVRPGDNLYSCSVIAVNPDTGKIQWHYQWTPHDVWDFDGVNENILFDQDGRKLLAHFDRNGYLFIIDRTNGKFVRATQFGDTVTWGTIDPDTGKVTTLLKPTPEGTTIAPGPAGIKEWPHACYSPKTGLLYTPAMQTTALYTLDRNQKFRESLPFWGGDAAVLKDPAPYGAVYAYDPATGKRVWEWRGKYPMLSSLLATAGGLVFGGAPDGNVYAWDASDGKVLWTYNTGSGIHSNPVTYSVNGKQYVAVPSGWGGWIDGFAPNTFGAPRGNALFVFALEEDAA